MEDQDKTKEELISELNELRHKVTKLEAYCTPLSDTETLKDPGDIFRRLLEGAPDAAFIQTGGVFSFLNQQALKLFGAKSVHELLGKPVFERFHPDCHEAIRERVRLVNTEKQQVPPMEHIYLRMDGSPINVNVSAVPANFQGENGALVFVRDITVRKLAEKVLRETQERLELALKGADLGWWDLDLTTGTGVIDDRIYEIINHSPGELECTLEVWQQLLHPDDVTGTLEHMQEHLQGCRDRLNYEYRIRKMSGEYAWVMAQGKIVERDQDNRPLRMAGTVMDITSRKNIEEKLQQREELLNLAVNAANLGLWDLDMTTGKATINERSAQILGYTLAELDATVDFWQNAIHPDDRSRVLELFRLRLVNPQDFSQSEYRLRTKSGKYIWIHSRGNTVRTDDAGNPLRMAGTFMDITERKQMEKALRRSERTFRTILSTSPVGIGLAQDRTMKWVNDAWVKMFGYDNEQECIGRSSGIFYSSSEEYKRVGNELYQGLETGRVTGVDAKGRKKDGSPFDAHVRLKLLNPNQPGGAAIAVLTDISERKNAEAQLKESQQRLEFALKGADLGWWDLDLKTGRVTIDERIAAMFGYGVDELEATLDLWQELIHPDDRPKVQESFRKSLENRQDFFELEYRVQTKSGRYMWIMSRGSTVERDSEGRPLRMSGAFIDITSRKQLEDELKESENRYQALFENMLEGFAYCKMLYDEEGRPLDWLYLSVNQGFYDLTGLRDVIGRKATEIMPGIREANPELFEIYGRVALTGNPEKIDAYVEPLGGIYLSISLTSPRREYFVAVFENVTERIKAQVAQVRLTAAIEQASEGIVILNPQGTIEYVNSGYESITGYSKQELVGSQHYLFQTDGGCDSLSFDLQQAIVKGLNWSGTVSRIRKDGSSYIEEVLLSPVRVSNGEITNYVLTKRDITKELDMQKRFLQSQKMEAVGTLAGGIAHDFNNILQVVSGYSELLLAGKEKTDKEFAELDKINSASQRGADLVQNLMMFSRKVEPNLKPLNLNDEVAQIQKLLSRTIPKNINITMHLSGDLSLIEADISQMGQTLMNLAVNARDAMPDGGVLNFETSNVDLDEEYCAAHPDFEPGKYVLLAVSDTGIGISKEALSHIFEPFYTTKAEGKGTGLGLATVYGIVKQHNGHITCSSQLGHGTTFKIYLSAIEQKLEAEAQETSTPIIGGTETILLVDDEEHLRDLGATMLNRYGYEVLVAVNGKEALDIYRAEYKKISLVVLDLIMPEMDGKKCLAEILNINPKANVLIASGHSEGILAMETSLPGAKGLVAKPYEMRKLLKTVREVLDAFRDPPLEVSRYD